MSPTLRRLCPGCRRVLVTTTRTCDACAPGGFARPSSGRSWDHGGRSAAKRGYDRRWREHTRPRILLRDGYQCQQCKREGSLRLATTVDHITRKAAGGDDSDSNLESLCSDHHRRKSGREGQLSR
jgi:5-methylcytosine-specific restriction protein A